MRPRSASLLLALFALLPATPARAAAPPDVSGYWRLTFTPATFRAVGRPIAREGGLDCEGACQASYQFEKPGAGDGRTTTLTLQLDASGCDAAPCDVRSLTNSNGYGFTGTLHYDGTAYTGTGSGFYGAPDCRAFLPKDTDRVRFTVDESVSPPTLAGELTVLLAYRGPTVNQKCGGVDGYELYTGTFTGTTTRSAAPAGPGADAGLAGGGLPGGLTGARRADAVAERDHTRPSLSTGVATAKDLPWRPSRVLVSALLALLLVLLMPFPAALFNNTLERHYDEVRGWFAFLRRRPRAAEPDARPDDPPAEEAMPAEPPPAPPAPPAARRWRDFALLVGAVALLDAFLDPGLGLDGASAMLVLGLAVSVAVVTLLGALPARLYGRRHGIGSYVALYPLGLGIAAFCVLVSRLTAFEPGYLYGVVAGFSLARELERAERGKVAWGTSAFLLVVAVAAFALRVPVHAAVTDGGGAPLGLLDTVLAAVFAAGVEANVIGMLPVRFMPGEAVFAWSRLAWAAAFGVSVFAFLHALSAAAGGASTGASVRTAAALFLAFGAASVAFWGYFRLRRGDPTPASV